VNIQLESFVRPDLLFEDVQRLAFWIDGSGAEMAVVPNGGLPNEVLALPTVRRAIHEIEAYRALSVLHVMVNKLKPGVTVPVHRDFLLPTRLQPWKRPTLERWHLPVATNGGCFFWDEDNGSKHMPLGFWTGPVPYWLRHSVRNEGFTERVHLVVDLDTHIRVGEYRD
jgi:hypothetical protein